MRARTVVWATVAVLLAAVFLYAALRGVDLRQLGHTIVSANLWLVTVCCVLTTVNLALRSARWRVLLNSEGRVPVAQAFWATAAGYFGNNFLPARAGELVRSYLITSASGLDMAYVLATALAERVVDAIVLVLLASVALVLFPAESGFLSVAARPFAIAGLIGVTVLVVLPRTGTWPQRTIARLPMWPGLRRLATTAVDGAIRGLGTFHAGAVLWRFLALTAIIWTLDASIAIVAAAAIDVALAWHVSLLLLAALGLASALPSSPGYVGIYQFVAVTILEPFGYGRADAVALVVVMQVTSYAVNALWGAIGVAHYRRSMREMADAAASISR
jgi:uncharacterized membrane protein YbhN (UPF0104 family)